MKYLFFFLLKQPLSADYSLIDGYVHVTLIIRAIRSQKKKKDLIVCAD